MKQALVLLTIFNLIIVSAVGQGLIEVPKEEYNKLKSPPILSSAGTQPTSYVIPLSRFPVVKSQGGQPSCTGWAVGYAFASFYLGAKGGWSPTSVRNTYSPSYVYQSIRECLNCTCGTRIDKALEFVRDVGVVPWENYPYSDVNCDRPPSRLNSVAEKFRIKDFYRIDDIKNLREIKTYLSNDIPVIVSIKADDEFDNFYNKSETAILTWSGKDYDYHAVVVIGYDDRRSAFKIMNSWGTSWGHNGFGWIDYDSFRKMVNQGFIVEKDYEFSTPRIVEDRPKNVIISENDFVAYGYKEPIGTNRSYFTFGLRTNTSIANQIQKVIYVYDHPSFYNKYSTSASPPYFTNSYEGWGCLNNMTAIIYFANGTTLKKEFNGCEVIRDRTSQSTTVTSINLNPKVTAEPTNESGRYFFRVELRGIEAVKDRVVKVVYDRNHSSFSTRYVETRNRDENFQGGYEGWGCLRELGVIVYFNDNTSKRFTIDMCKVLGW